MALDGERELDRALSAPAEGAVDPEVAPLVDAARRLRASLAVDAPPARRERALFVSAVAAGKPRLTLGRLVLPAAAMVAAAVVFGFVGRNSLPGDALYPARDFLAAVGVARSPGDEADRRIAAARAKLVRAETEQVLGRRLDLAYEAVADLERAEGIARRLDSPDRLTMIAALEDSAGATIAQARAERVEDSSGPGRGDDSRGHGGGDSGSEDSSGHGSGDSGADDSSGHGGGDDSVDSSGHGSDDIAGDSSGHGGGSGGPGSGGSGSHSSGGED